MPVPSHYRITISEFVNRETVLLPSTDKPFWMNPTLFYSDSVPFKPEIPLSPIIDHGNQLLGVQREFGASFHNSPAALLQKSLKQPRIGAELSAEAAQSEL